MHVRFPWFAAITLAALCTAVRAADDRTFDAHFERPYKAGQTFSVSSADTIRSSQKTRTPDGQTAGTSSFRRMLLDADVKIDQVDEKKQPAGMTLTIRKLTAQSTAAGQEDLDATPQDLLLPGTTVTVTFADGEPAFKDRAGKPITDDAFAVLRGDFGPSPLKDDVYGSAERKKIGDAWPVNTRNITVDRFNPQAVDPANLAGNVTLKSVGRVGGVECAQFEATLTSSKVSVGEVKPTEAKLTIIQTAALPVETSRPATANSTKTTLHVVVEQKPLGKGVVRTTIDSETSHEVTWTGK